MHFRRATSNTGIWENIPIQGFLHSAVIKNAGSEPLYIGTDDSPPSAEYLTLNAGETFVIEPFDTSQDNPRKIHTNFIWYRDDATNQTTIEVIYTTK